MPQFTIPSSKRPISQDHPSDPPSYHFIYLYPFILIFPGSVFLLPGSILERAHIIMEREQSQFQVVWSQTSHSFIKEPMFGDIMKQCRAIEAQLVHDFLLVKMRKMISDAKDKFQNDNDCCQIITIEYKHNQMTEFPVFIKLLTDQFLAKKFEIFRQLPPEKVDIVFITNKEVREIVLNIYICLEERANLEFVVFIVSEITDLDEWNLYCFEKGLRGKKMMVFIGTHYHFNNDIQYQNQSFEKYHYQLYNSKDLFCAYLYRCLTNNKIKPYLPGELLSLVSDMSYYEISYHESCRRFMYCLERALMLNRKERTFVDFDNLVQILQIALFKEMKHYEGAQRRFSRERLLRIILIENERLHFSEHELVLEVAMRSAFQQLIQQIHIINCMREHARNTLAKKDKWKKYLDYLDQSSDAQPEKETGRRKKSRSERLGLTNLKTHTPKSLLEEQITRIIKDATAGIRQQAMLVRWEDINYELRIKPQLPYLIKEAWAAHEDTNELMEELTRNYNVPLTHYLQMFKKEELGKGIYLIKCLELAGLIFIKKNQVKPIVYTTFFDKANFKVLS